MAAEIKQLKAPKTAESLVLGLLWPDARDSALAIREALEVGYSYVCLSTGMTDDDESHDDTLHQCLNQLSTPPKTPKPKQWARPDVGMSSQDWGRRAVLCSSGWLGQPLCRSNSATLARMMSGNRLQQEIEYAAYLGVHRFVLRLPNLWARFRTVVRAAVAGADDHDVAETAAQCLRLISPSVIPLARTVYACLQRARELQVVVVVPLGWSDGELPSSSERRQDDGVDTIWDQVCWGVWDVMKSMCMTHPRLVLSVELQAPPPVNQVDRMCMGFEGAGEDYQAGGAGGLLDRWCGEPLVSVILYCHTVLPGRTAQDIVNAHREAGVGPGHTTTGADTLSTTTSESRNSAGAHNPPPRTSSSSSRVLSATITYFLHRAWDLRATVLVVVPPPDSQVTEEEGSGDSRQRKSQLDQTQTRQLTHTFYALRAVFAQRPVLSAMDQSFLMCRDYLEHPLQPLRDNLGAGVYECFERDPVKYHLYQNAVRQALLDKFPVAVPPSLMPCSLTPTLSPASMSALSPPAQTQGHQPSQTIVPVQETDASFGEPEPAPLTDSPTVCQDDDDEGVPDILVPPMPDCPVRIGVFGAGRGPLVTGVLRAAAQTSRWVQLVVVEKNSHAVNALLQRVQTQWRSAIADLPVWGTADARPCQCARAQVAQSMEGGQVTESMVTSFGGRSKDNGLCAKRSLDGESSVSTERKHKITRALGANVCVRCPDKDCGVQLCTHPQHTRCTCICAQCLQRKFGPPVQIVQGDMRSLPPMQLDCVVSELLGSFGDNELSPECLSGASSTLRPGAFSIPAWSLSYMAPISSRALWSKVQAFVGTKGGGGAGSGGQYWAYSPFETPFVVKAHNMTLLADNVPAFFFHYPGAGHTDRLLRQIPHDSADHDTHTWFAQQLGLDSVDQSTRAHVMASLRAQRNTLDELESASGRDTGLSGTEGKEQRCGDATPTLPDTPSVTLVDHSRFALLQFPPAFLTAQCHGFVGYFHSHLYGSHHMSIRPESFSRGMFSWFVMYFPLSSPMLVRKGQRVQLALWRRVNRDSGRVWYEWSVIAPQVSHVHNLNGRASFIGM